ncbi:hypothetical protein CQW39_26800 [Streptomyces griseofuscus]|uniref:ABC transporter ATP-binding protein/permease n=1 Tax=Streptomyces griseofuscus TaxID=146922 RepID=UPI000F649328|nr:ABC transporter ATP-binding protein/permease [Streptomyces griseofuscus]RRQ74736.1 hypothetical protein CQW39_26800 [Streptomyces griseofuscus]
MRGIRHRYGDGPDVLHGIDLDIRPGPGIPTAGLARPGAPGNRRIVLVTQEHHLFPGTVADNLRLACREASDERPAATLAVTWRGPSTGPPWR